MTQSTNPLKELLQERGIRQIDLARRIGVHRATVCHVVQGDDTSARIVAAIAAELGLSVDQVRDLIPRRKAA